MNGNIVITDRINLSSDELMKLKKIGSFKSYDDLPDENEMINRVANADYLLVNFARIGRRVIEACENLKLISQHGTGVDNIDILAATEHQVAVSNVPGYATHSVAELACLLMLALARNYDAIQKRMKNNNWESESLEGINVHGKTIGIIGLGRIGKQMAVNCISFGMKVIAHDINPDNQFATIHGIKFTSIDELLNVSDFISLHVPLTEITKNMIGQRQFKCIKEGAFLINTCRGGVVDEKSLIKSLKAGNLAGAALDVFQHEPLGIDSQFRSLPNVILTPHIGWNTYESKTNCSYLAITNIENYILGKPTNIINPSVLYPD